MPLNISTDRGQTVVDPATLPAGTVIKVYGSVPMPYKRALRALTSVATGNVLPMASIAGIVVGLSVTGTNIATNTTVSAVDPVGKTITLSTSITGTVASGASLTFSGTTATSAATASGSNLSVPTAGLSLGMTISGTNIDPSATVSAIVDANNLTMSAAALGAIASGAAVTFGLAGGRATSAAVTPSAATPLNLQVIPTNPNGLLGNSYENVVGAMVYNERMVTFAALSHAVKEGWALVPMANILPAAPTYV